MKAKSEIFRGTFTSWETLRKRAEEFATGLGPQRVISISHSADGAEGVIMVWYWDGTPSSNEAHNW